MFNVPAWNLPQKGFYKLCTELRCISLPTLLKHFSIKREAPLYIQTPGFCKFSSGLITCSPTIHYYFPSRAYFDTNKAHRVILSLKIQYVPLQNNDLFYKITCLLWQRCPDHCELLLMPCTSRFSRTSDSGFTPTQAHSPFPEAFPRPHGFKIKA